jgi:5,10-methylenetetrahydromethanopterin reductase
MARPVAVHWGFLGFGGPWLAAAELDLPKLEIPQAVREIYPDLSHAEDWEAATAATSFVPDDVVGRICDAIGLIGTPEDCARKIVETASLGVRAIYLMPLQSFALPRAEVRAFCDVVFPRLREAGLRAA